MTVAPSVPEGPRDRKWDGSGSVLQYSRSQRLKDIGKKN